VTIKQLILAGALSPPVAIERRYKGRALDATIEREGSVAFAGKAYDSLSQAAAAARATVIGPTKDGRLPATNGWEFWKLRGANATLDSVRRSFLRRESGGRGAS